MTSIYTAISQLLLSRGWSIDDAVKENASGELHEFIHPENGKRMAYLDAICAEGDLDLEREKFATAVASFLEKSEMNIRDIGQELEVIPSTIRRWANGETSPKAGMRALAYAWMEKKMKEKQQ